jgi:hypothetical protein
MQDRRPGGADEKSFHFNGLLFYSAGTAHARVFCGHE